MKDDVDPKIREAVSSFFRDRREGRRVSVEAALGASASAKEKSQATRLIAEAARQLGPPSIVSGTGTGAGAGAGGAGGDGAAEAFAAGELPLIEGYDIIDMIGRGGMGAVYEAYQQSTGRRVAVKLMLETLAAGERTRRRFEREVELVARLQHPNIVSVLDSGIHKGRHFYVMEFIEGRTLDAVFTPGQADPRAVLAILAKVAGAVDYAHQRGVIHRDLKPANILIDERGEPHLLDFGLAKSFDPNSLVGVRASLSEPGQFLGTLAYMPPEQARGDTEHMSVRSDVYSLGAIGYEMITGRPPCGVDGPLGLILERINSIDPARPSSLRAGVERDCDAILLKCLEKAPARRYASAGEFAADIRRSLNHEPILARRTPLAVRGARWVRRHKLATTVCVAAVLLAAAIAGGWVNAVRQRLRVLETVTAIQKAQVEQNARPVSGPPSDPRLNIASLRQTAQQVSLVIPEKALEADVRHKLGWAFNRWGGECYRDAVRELERSRDLFAETVGPDSIDYADAVFNLASAQYWLAEHEASLANYQKALAVQERRLGRRESKTLETIYYMASPLQSLGRYAEAEALLREVLDARRPLLSGADRWQLAGPLNNLGHLLIETGQFAEAEQMAREAIPLARLHPADPGVYEARATSVLAVAALKQGRGAEALAMFDDALARKRAQYGGIETDDVARTMSNRADALALLGRESEAMKACDEALEIRRRALGESHTDFAVSLLQKARFLLAQGGPRGVEGARPLAAQAASVWSAALRADHPNVAEAESIAGECDLRAGRPGAAEPLLRRAAGVLIGTRTARHPATRRAVLNLCEALRALGHAGEAREWEARLPPERAAAAVQKQG